jgi:hypothetical protein
MKNLYFHRVVVCFALLFSVGFAYGQTPTQKQQIIRDYDQNNLQRLQSQFQSEAARKKQEAQDLARQNGWEIIKRNADGSFDELIAVSPDGQPIYFSISNVAAARSTRANHLHNGGTLGLNVEGQSMTAHVWDGGPTRTTHQEFDGAGGNNRVSINDGVTGLNGNSFHAQHVTGTIVASGFVANAKGMAPQARALTHDWDNDLAEATSEASSGMLVSNHSYGYRASLIPDWYFGAYIDVSRDWDDLMYNSPYYLMVVAAGNDGNDNSSNGAPLNGSSSYDKLSGHSTSKNNMVVANGQDANVNNDGSLNSVSINSSSSEGPTDDLRIKPDITGNGTSVYSTYDNSDAAYNSISGTSMASPNVAGSLLLLQQHANNVGGSFMRSATLKGVALHTADDAGISGPDAIYGWGLMNTKAAAEAITQNGNESLISELTLSPGQTYTVNVDASGSAPLIASISWTDPAGTANTGTTNLTTPVLVNDLDIRVSQGGSTFSPYRLTGVNSNSTGDNNVDPYERVDINGATGSYTITVTHKGSLSGGSQNYSLVVTGLTGTPPVCTVSTPTGVNSSSVGTTTATISWNSVPLASYDLRYRQVGTSSWTTTSVSGTSSTLSGLASDTQYEAQVRSKCPDNSTSAYSSSINFTTSSTNCSGGISSFPYSESFENTLGAWTQATGDDLDWTVDSGGTPSSSTGPSTGTDGSYYVYIEASSPNYPTKRAILNSPCLNLGGESGASISFDYHMIGNAVGTLDLEASNDNGNTWTSLWTRSGAQGSGWNSEDISLNAYAGGTLLLRFNGVTATSWQGDIAIDNVVISGGSTADTQAPTVPTGLAASNVQQTTLTLNWNASTDNVGVTEYDVYQGATVLGSVTGTSANVTGLTANTSYTFSVTAKDAAGNVSANSSSINVTTLGTGGLTCSTTASAPYSESFENTFGAWTNQSGDDFDWSLRSGGTPSSNTGPSSANDGSYYIYTESSSPNYSTKVAIIESPCFDLAGTTSPTLTFKYHMYGASAMGGLVMEATTDDNTWSTVWSQSGNQGNAWLDASVNLSAYAGGSVKLRIVGTTGTTWQGDMAIDKVELTDGTTPPGTDVTLTLVLDNYPEETSWTLSQGGSTIASGGTYGSQPDGSTVTETFTLAAGCYDFTINDAYGDGICCAYGNGSYTLTEGSTTLASGGSFTSTETKTFCVGGATTSMYDIFQETREFRGTFTVSPNPAEDYLMINVLDIKADAFEILDLSGKRMLSGVITENQTKVSLATIPTGFYLIRVINSKGGFVEKISIK